MNLSSVPHSPPGRTARTRVGESHSTPGFRPSRVLGTMGAPTGTAGTRAPFRHRQSIPHEHCFPGDHRRLAPNSTKALWLARQGIALAGVVVSTDVAVAFRLAGSSGTVLHLTPATLGIVSPGLGRLVYRRNLTLNVVLEGVRIGKLGDLCFVLGGGGRKVVPTVSLRDYIPDRSCAFRFQPAHLLSTSACPTFWPAFSRIRPTTTPLSRFAPERQPS